MYAISISPSADIKMLSFPTEFEQVEGKAISNFHVVESPYITDIYGDDVVLLVRNIETASSKDVFNEFGTSVANHIESGLFEQKVVGDVYFLKKGDYGIPVGLSKSHSEEILDWLEIQLVFYRKQTEVTL